MGENTVGAEQQCKEQGGWHDLRDGIMSPCDMAPLGSTNFWEVKEETDENLYIFKTPKVLLGESVDWSTGPEPAGVTCSLKKS